MSRPVLAVLLLACLGACLSDRPPLLIDGLEITAPLPGNDMSAGYFELTNTTAAPLVITRVASPDFERVMMHETTIDDGIARMRMLEEITVPAGQTVRFSRGGKHLMLSGAGPTADLVTLQFYAGDALLLSISTRTGMED